MGKISRLGKKRAKKLANESDESEEDEYNE